jgi:hypothetical protein
MSSSLGQVIFSLGYEISPILLTNGIAAGIPWQTLPIVALTEATNFTTGLLSGNLDLNLDNYFAHYKPIPGATLISQQIGQYPFANQTVAANAVIAQPLNVSLMMICPATSNGGFAAKLTTLEMLQKTLATHNLSGGTYTVVTPSYIYTNCVMLGMRDISTGETQQPQVQWQLDFQQPLVALSDAQGLLSSLMTKLQNGLPVTSSSWSGLSSTTGNALTVTGSLITGTQAATGSLTGAASSLVGSASSTASAIGVPGASS